MYECGVWSERWAARSIAIVERSIQAHAAVRDTLSDRLNKHWPGDKGRLACSRVCGAPRTSSLL